MKPRFFSRSVKSARSVRLLIAAVSALAGGADAAAAASCPAAPVAVQVLGSGGPIAEGGRAGTSYLVRVDGVPRLLVDAGPGSFLRFAEAGAQLATVRAIALSHLHVDHSGDLIDILNSGTFETLGEHLMVIGPDGRAPFPSIAGFLQAMVGRQSGAFAYLGGYTDGTDDRPRLDMREVTTAEGAGKPVVIDLEDGMKLTAIPVHHGVVPSLGFRLEVAGKSIVFAGDQSFLSESFETFLQGSRPDLLIAHHAIPEGQGQPRGLHRSPGSIGELATRVAARRLILSHNMKRALDRLPEGLAAIGARYDGPVHVVADLECILP